MRENQLEEELKRAEEIYDGLIQTQRSFGTMLAEVIRKGEDLDEFGRRLRVLPHLIWQADFRRTELRRKLLDLRTKRAEEHRRARKEASRAARSLEQARKAYVVADEAARRTGLEARRLAELRDKEVHRLQVLHRVEEETKHQRSPSESRGEQEKIQEEGEAAQGQPQGE